MIALIEEIGAITLAKGALDDIAKRMKLADELPADTISRTQAALYASALSDAMLRHRLWVRLARALAIPTTPPLSNRSARQSAASLAIRASERLTPAVIARRKDAIAEGGPTGIVGLLGKKAADVVKEGRTMLTRKEPLPFPVLVREELLHMLADDGFLTAAQHHGDPALRAELQKAHENARMALAAGGGWVAFAALVGNAGFLPYMLAAQLSAWIPLVSGPALVSLLATLINPLTVMAGVAALGWLAVGRGADVVRSQVAARLCVLLALSGSQQQMSGFEQFLSDMRALGREPSSAFGYLSDHEKKLFRHRMTSVSSRLLSTVPEPAGNPPPPWDKTRFGAAQSDVTDAALVASATAGEMLWHAVAIDEKVILAADFSRSADLGDPITFATQAHTFLMEGAGYGLRGYTAEQVVLNKLIENGHDARLAEASNTPGLDLIVDGNPVQVKCGSELSNLTEHFEKYPDIPVIANSELVEKAIASGADWSSMVSTLPGFDISTIEAEIERTLGHAFDLANTDITDLMFLSGIFRGGVEVAQGRIALNDLPPWLLLDGASRGVLSLAGMKAGGWIGLIAIGPAGALVLGPALGCVALLGNSALKEQTRNFLMRNWKAELIECASDLHASMVAALERRIAHLSRRTERLQERYTNQTDLMSHWMVRRSRDDLIAAIEVITDLGDAPRTEERCVELLINAAETACVDVPVKTAMHVLQVKFSEKPGLNELLVRRPLDNVSSVLETQVRAGLKKWMPNRKPS